jgi:hypothetical protein
MTKFLRPLIKVSIGLQCFGWVIIFFNPLVSVGIFISATIVSGIEVYLLLEGRKQR